MRDQELGNDGDEEEGETCSPSVVLAADYLWRGGVSQGRGGGWQEFQKEEATETEVKGGSQAFWELGKIWCGGSVQFGKEL